MLHHVLDVIGWDFQDLRQVERLHRRRSGFAQNGRKLANDVADTQRREVDRTVDRRHIVAIHARMRPLQMTYIGPGGSPSRTSSWQPRATGAAERADRGQRIAVRKFVVGIV